MEWYVLMFIGRVLTGIGYGLVAVVGPLYIVEIASKEIRGALTMCVTLASTSGIFIQFCMGLVLEVRWLAVVSMTPVVIMVVGMIFMPESPRWLVSRGRHAKALSALTWLRRGTEQDVMQEYNQIEENFKRTDTGLCLNYRCTREEFTSAFKPIIICAMLFVFQQLSGTTPIIFNAQQIFLAVGFEASILRTGQIPAIILAAVKMVATVLGICLIDRVGRRPLFISCGVAMGIACIVVGLYFKYTRYLQDDFTWLPLLALILYETAFSIAWGGIPWLLLSEMPPIQFRGVAAVTGSVASRLASFLITQEFADLLTLIQFSGTFWLFGAVSVAGSLFAWKFMPETNQKSLECIEQDLTMSVHDIHALTDSTT
jgi:sugar porter (SP) family MFS transporter